MSKFAKYQYPGHPAMRRMLVEGRRQALEKSLGLLEIRLDRSQDVAERQRLTEKIGEVKAQIARLRRLPKSGGDD